MSYESRGVGLRFEGLPTDILRFNWVLAKEGCHPKAAERILNRLRINGVDLLTVQSNLPLEWIKEELEKIGVTMTMTMIQPLKDWKPLYEDADGPWPKDVLKSIGFYD